MKYKFNHKSLSFERAKATPLQVFKQILSYVAAAIAFAVVTLILYTFFFESPKEKQLKRELHDYHETISLIEKRMDLLTTVLQDLEEKDNNLYRAILDATPPNKDIQLGDLQSYYALLSSQNHSEALNRLQLKTNVLTQRTQHQLLSYEHLWELAKEKDTIQASIPAISPVKNPTIVSGFGMRFHPIYKILRPHTGVDLIGKKGTPIYATADGTVISNPNSYSGYGITVILDHGRGYQTLYAHLSKKNVKDGQRVKRGDVIGFMGTTGLSVGVHLHYEVIKNGKKVNPVHYFFGNLTPEEYNRILQQASEANQSLS
ncbi:MAG: M23 family metallopeptidase [Bacteroidales bacterium]|nr:M23 family metallopeptidase [Bacteroidales bacterium]